MSIITLDVTENHQQVSEFIQQLQPIRQPIEIMLGGTLVGRIIPPEELSQAEKEKILQEGWLAVQEARARNKGLPEREIAKVVDTAVKRVRSQQ
jgi:hypothetical protein